MIKHIRTDGEEKVMWYFTWILGLLLAVCLGIINVMWLESNLWSD